VTRPHPIFDELLTNIVDIARAGQPKRAENLENRAPNLQVRDPDLPRICTPADVSEVEQYTDAATHLEKAHLAVAAASVDLQLAANLLGSLGYSDHAAAMTRLANEISDAVYEARVEEIEGELTAARHRWEDEHPYYGREEVMP
jgi:hypothetical protein